MKQTMIESHRINRILALIPLSRSLRAVIPLTAMRLNNLRKPQQISKRVTNASGPYSTTKCVGDLAVIPRTACLIHGNCHKKYPSLRFKSGYERLMKPWRTGFGQKHIFGKFKYYKYPDPESGSWHSSFWEQKCEVIIILNRGLNRICEQLCWVIPHFFSHSVLTINLQRQMSSF